MQTFSVVQWLRLCAPNAGGPGSILGQRTKIPHAMQCGQKLKQKHQNIGNKSKNKQMGPN